MTVGLWKLSSLDGRRPPWCRPLLAHTGSCQRGVSVWPTSVSYVQRGFRLTHFFIHSLRVLFDPFVYPSIEGSVWPTFLSIHRGFRLTHFFIHSSRVPFDPLFIHSSRVPFDPLFIHSSRVPFDPLFIHSSRVPFDPLFIHSSKVPSDLLPFSPYSLGSVWSISVSSIHRGFCLTYFCFTYTSRVPFDPVLFCPFNGEFRLTSYCLPHWSRIPFDLLPFASLIENSVWRTSVSPIHIGLSLTYIRCPFVFDHRFLIGLMLLKVSLIYYCFTYLSVLGGSLHLLPFLLFICSSGFIPSSPGSAVVYSRGFFFFSPAPISPIYLFLGFHFTFPCFICLLFLWIHFICSCFTCLLFLGIHFTFSYFTYLCVLEDSVHLFLFHLFVCSWGFFSPTPISTICLLLWVHFTF